MSQEIKALYHKVRAGIDPETKQPHITEEEFEEAISQLLIEARLETELLKVDGIIEEWQQFPDDGDFTNWLFGEQSKLQRQLKFQSTLKRKDT